MKYKLLFTFLSFHCLTTFAQQSNDKIIYLDSLDNTATEINFKYKRIVKDYYNNQDLYKVTDYYKSGEIRMSGITSNKYEMKFVGILKEFYENGNKKRLTNIIDSKSSKQFEWYENGQKKSETENSFSEEKSIPIVRYLQFWDKNNIQTVIYGNGKIEIDTENGNENGDVINGYKNGKWTGTDKKHNLTYSENYAKGKLISGTSIDSDKIEYHYSVLYNFGRKNKKGIHKLLDDISRKLLLEDASTKDKATIIISVDTEGKLDSVQTTPDISDKLQETIKKYNQKTPVIYRGVAIPYSFPLVWTPI